MPTTKSLSFTEFVEYMLDQDSGAQAALDIMLKANPPEANRALLKLDDLDIRGINIWYCYQDICKMDVAQLFKKVANGSVAAELERIPHARYKRPRVLQ